MENRTLIEAFFVRERSRRRNILAVMWSLVVFADAMAIFAYLQGTGVARILQYLAFPLAVSFSMLWFALYLDKTLQHRLSMLLDSVEFGWDELHGLDLNQKEADHLQHAFAATTIGRLATNESYLRTRGGDEKGPAFDKTSADVNPHMARVDPSLHEGDYEGLEDDLRVAEQLVEQANQHYAEEAQRQWELAEQRDMDMVEAGVDRLGDLVAQGWFEQNPEDGALAALMERAEDDDGP